MSLLATQQPDYEKLLLQSEPFLSAEEHTWRNFCLCEKYQQLIGLEEIQKNPFLASPQELSQRIMNLTASTHTQEMCVSACMLSSFPHGLSNRRHFDGGDSTMINVLLSIFQPLCSTAFVSLFPLLLVSQSMTDKLEVSFLLIFLLSSLLLE